MSAPIVTVCASSAYDYFNARNVTGSTFVPYISHVSVCTGQYGWSLRHMRKESDDGATTAFNL